MAGQPDIGDVHVDALLSNISIAHFNAMEAYVADRVFPLVYVDKQSDVYPVFDRGFFFADEGDQMRRAPATNAAETGYKITNTNQYFADNFAIAHVIPDELRANADAVFNLDDVGTRLVTQLQMIRRERAFATDFMVTGVWGTDKTGTTDFPKWSTYATSDPFTDLRLGIRTVLRNTGARASKLVLGRLTWDRLVDHPDFLDRVAGGATGVQPAKVTRSLFAQLLEIEEVLVSEAVFRTSVEGPTPTMDFIFDDDALLLYTPMNASLMDPAAGYTFVWRSAINGAQAPQFIRRIREDRPKRDIIESYSYWDQKITEAQSGYFFNDAVD